MGRTLTAKPSVSDVFRLNDAGQLVKVEPDFNEYGTPPKGTRAKLRLSGISEEFEMQSAFSNKPTTNVRVEFQVIKAAGNAGALINGRRFTDLYTWKISAKSNLGKLLGALRGEPIRDGEEINPDHFIGTEFTGTTTLSDDGKYPGVSVDSIESGSVKLPLTATAKPAQTNGVYDAADVNADLDEEDPFA